MPHYFDVERQVAAMAAGSDDWLPVIDKLLDLWLDEYARVTRSSNIVETRATSFAYLFDIDEGRLLAAWGVSQGKNSEPRPASRMSGHPLGTGPNYHRGHAIPHTLGGGTDINLVPQLGRINIGPFRPLEKQAVATPGSFYFTYWKYRGAVGQRSQVPTGVDQGLLIAGQQPQITPHGN